MEENKSVAWGVKGFKNKMERRPSLNNVYNKY